MRNCHTRLDGKKTHRVQSSSVDSQTLALLVKSVEMVRRQKRVVRRESLDRRRRSRVTMVGQGRSATPELLLLDDLQEE